MASAMPFVATEFQLSPLAVGSVLSAFFLGYSLMQIPGGFLADKLGPNRVLTAAIATWSALTALTGLATSLTGLLILRVLFGASEGAFPSAASKALASWFPQREVGRANGLMLAASQLGASVAPTLVATLVITLGWRYAFYVLLIPGVVLAAVVRKWLIDSPAHSERREDMHDHPRSAAASLTSSPIIASLQTPAVLWCFVAAFFSNLASWGLMNWLPTYLLQARGFSAAKMGLFAAIPSLAGALGYALGGQISDRWFSERRQLPVLIGLVASAGFVYLAAIASSGEVTVLLLAAAFFFLLTADLGICTLPLVIVPQQAVGSAFGFVNTAAQSAGFLSPLLVGYLLNATDSNFTVVFYCFVGCLLLAAGAAALVRQDRGIFARPCTQETGRDTRIQRRDDEVRVSGQREIPPPRAP